MPARVSGLISTGQVPLLYFWIFENHSEKGRTRCLYMEILAINFTWPGNGIYYYGSNEKPDLNGGLYTDIGLGYQKGIGKNDALVLSAGYSYKTFTEYITAFPLCLIGYPCEPYQSEFLYKLNRLSFKIGWRF